MLINYLIYKEKKSYNFPKIIITSNWFLNTRKIDDQKLLFHVCFVKICLKKGEIKILDQQHIGRKSVYKKNKTNDMEAGFVLKKTYRYFSTAKNIVVAKVTDRECRYEFIFRKNANQEHFKRTDHSVNPLFDSVINLVCNKIL